MKLFKSVFLAVAIAGLFYFSGCDSCENATNVEAPLTFDQDLTDISLEIEGVELVETEEIEEPLTLRPNREPRPPRHMVSIFRILHELRLTERQHNAIHGFLLEHRDCEMSIMRRLHEAQSDIIERAEQRRREIIRLYNAGEIDRREAHRMLRVLHQHVREALHNSDARRAAHAALKDCMCELFSQIESVLTDRQLEMWNRYLESRGIECDRED